MLGKMKKLCGKDREHSIPGGKQHKNGHNQIAFKVALAAASEQGAQQEHGQDDPVAKVI